MKSDIGIYGLGSMGQNIALNFASKGFSVSVYNRQDEGEEKVLTDFLETKCQNYNNIKGYNSEKEFVESLKDKKTIFLMIQAGNVVDIVIDRLLGYLNNSGIIIDGGNSYYKDSIRRYEYLKTKNIEFAGCGVSGGTYGALHGPSIMVGCTVKTWENIKQKLQAIAAKSDDNGICCQRIGDSGAGHYVKMVHNGIEYSIMQVLAEIFDIQKNMLDMDYNEIHEVFSDWNKKDLNSYLLGISIDILTLKNSSQEYQLDNILDVASHKGTGKETSISALEYGIPATMTSQAVFARYLSSLLDERMKLSKIYPKKQVFIKDRKEYMEMLYFTTYISLILAYTQGISLIQRASQENNWDIDILNVIKVWKGGCIIQSKLLYEIEKVIPQNTDLLSSQKFSEIINEKIFMYRSVVADSILNSIAVPVLAAGVTFFDSITNSKLPTNFIQAQRDYFGAHGFEKVDALRNQIFHLDK